MFSQAELIAEREKRGVYDVRPGITGLAQVNDIDMSTPGLLAETDSSMVKAYSVKLYFKLILKTIIGHGLGDRVK
jgi:lipopolysaccharide/colanic/teichoic acid biosynthesis glycosyltransferase